MLNVSSDNKQRYQIPKIEDIEYPDSKDDDVLSSTNVGSGYSLEIAKREFIRPYVKLFFVFHEYYLSVF